MQAFIIFVLDLKTLKEQFKIIQNYSDKVYYYSAFIKIKTLKEQFKILITIDLYYWRAGVKVKNERF